MILIQVLATYNTIKLISLLYFSQYLCSNGDIPNVLSRCAKLKVCEYKAEVCLYTCKYGLTSPKLLHVQASNLVPLITSLE